MAEFQKIYATLSDDAYGKNYTIDGWERITNVNINGMTNNQGYYSDILKGFEASAYKKYIFDANGQKVYTGEITVAYRGTDSLNDMLVSDLGGVVAGVYQTQYGDAKKFYDAITAQYGSNVTITGHSLGGGLAQLVAANYGKTAYTFNAPGMLPYINSNDNWDKITNYVIMNDYVGNFGDHFGNTYYIEPVPIGNNPNLGTTGDTMKDTHNSILNYNAEYFGNVLDLGVPAGFSQDEALSMWFYDVNTNPIIRETFRALNTVFFDTVSKSSLQTAVSLLNTLDSPKNQLHFRTSEGDYILGDAKGSDLSGVLTGSEHNDLIYGNEGNDIILGGSGNDTIYGDFSNESNYNSTISYNDWLFGEAGNDLIYGGFGNDNSKSYRPVLYR